MHTQSRPPSRSFTVRLAHACGGLVTQRAVFASDADHAAALALKAVEADTGRSGWVLDGPVEDEAAEQLDAAIDIARRKMVDARRDADAAAEQYNDLVRRKVQWERKS